MSAGIFTDLKDNLLQLREIQRHADKPYSQHVRDVKGQQSQRQRLSAPHETAQLPKAKEAASSQSILSRSSSFVSVKNGNDAELEALKKRYASTVRLLAESLEEQSNLRAVMELTTNPGEIDSILQHDEFRLAALGPGLGGAGASEAEEASFLLRSIKIRSIVMEKERLLEETIDLRTRLEQERAKRAEAEAQLTVTQTLYQEAQRDLESAQTAIVQLQRQYAESQHRSSVLSSSSRDWNDLFADQKRDALLPPPLPPVDDEVDPVDGAAEEDKRPLSTRPPRTPPSLHPRKAKDFLGQLESSLRQPSQRARPPAQSFEDFERERTDEDALLDSLEEAVPAPGLGHAASEQHAHSAFRDVSDTNGFDFDAEEAAALDVEELSDDDFPAAPAAAQIDQQPPAATSSFAESDDAEYLAYGDEDDSGDGGDDASRGSSAERVILSIDLDDADGPAELEVRTDTIPAAAALAFLQQHGLSPEYFEPLVRQVEQLQEALRREQAERADHLLVDLSVAEAPRVNAQGGGPRQALAEQSAERLPSPQAEAAASPGDGPRRRQFHAAVPRDWGASVGSEAAPPALSLSVLSTGSAARTATANRGTQTPPLSPKDSAAARSSSLAAALAEESADEERPVDEEDEVDLLDELDASFAEDRRPDAAPVAAVPAPAPAAAPVPVRRSSLLPVVPRSAQSPATATAASKVFEEYKRPGPQSHRVASGDGAQRAPAELVDSDAEDASAEDAEAAAWPTATHAPQRVGQLVRRPPVAGPRDDRAGSSSLGVDRRAGPVAAATAAAQPSAKASALGGMVMRKKPAAALGEVSDLERSRASVARQEGRPNAAGREGGHDSGDESADTLRHGRALTPGRPAVRSAGEPRAAARPQQQQLHVAQAAAKAVATSPLSSPTSTASTTSDGRGLRERGARTRPNDPPTPPSNGAKKTDHAAGQSKGGSGFFSSFLRSKHSADGEPRPADDRGRGHVPASGAAAGLGARTLARDKGGRSASTPRGRGTEKINLL